MKAVLLITQNLNFQLVIQQFYNVSCATAHGMGYAAQALVFAKEVTPVQSIVGQETRLDTPMKAEQ